MVPEITVFDNTMHRDQVIALWQEIFRYETPHNAPALVIDKKLDAGDGLFFVALNGRDVIGTVMAGYDGHRGWMYSIAVSPEFRHQGIGTALLLFAERKLSELGCVKINLQIMDGNEAVQKFYAKCGYDIEQRISMGKRLPENIS